MNIVRMYMSGAQVYENASTHKTHRWLNEQRLVTVSITREGKDSIYFVHPRERMHEIDVKSH